MSHMHKRKNIALIIEASSNIQVVNALKMCMEVSIISSIQNLHWEHEKMSEVENTKNSLFVKASGSSQFVKALKSKMKFT